MAYILWCTVCEEHDLECAGGRDVIGKQERWQEDLFVAGSLRDLIPEDHILRRVDAVLDLSWLREEIADSYCEDNGRPGIDPEAALRLMLAGLLHGIVHDRHLMREAQVNLAIRWFAGYGLDERLPDHSTLTRIRQRWGVDRFRSIFQRTVRACAQAGLVAGKTVHVDATLIRADVSWDSIAEKHVERIIEANPVPEQCSRSASINEGRQSTPQKRRKKSRTDPDAALATMSRAQKVQPSYKQHTAVDDKAGVVVDVHATAGDVNEGDLLLEQVGRIEASIGRGIQAVTADSGYAYGKVYGGLERKGIDAVIPPKAEPRAGPRLPISRFKYDGKYNIVRCPKGKILRRSSLTKHGWYYRTRCQDCKGCSIRTRCLSPRVDRRTIVISHDYEALLRARRRRHRWPRHLLDLYARHKWRAEGAHAEAKTRHGLHRAARRGLENVAIQVYLTASVMNLKRLAA